MRWIRRSSNKPAGGLPDASTPTSVVLQSGFLETMHECFGPRREDRLNFFMAFDWRFAAEPAAALMVGHSDCPGRQAGRRAIGQHPPACRAGGRPSQVGGRQGRMMASDGRPGGHSLPIALSVDGGGPHDHSPASHTSSPSGRSWPPNHPPPTDGSGDDGGRGGAR